jgi:thiosulfate reductase cytochrome b subunit
MEKIYLYPVWLRLWHVVNALLFILLILSGISLHFSADNELLVGFEIAVLTHNISGIVLSLNYLLFFLMNIFSGNYKYYIPRFKNLTKKIIIQAKFYLVGIFDHEPHPFAVNKESKFNPMQQLGYLSIMYGLIPLIIVSGWALLFPEYAPQDFFGFGGVWPMAITHTIVGFALIIFMVVHIYLGTTGHTAGELFKTIINGWHLAHDDEEASALITKKKIKEKGKLFPIFFYNPISITGTIITSLSFFSIIILIIIEFVGTETGAYIGIITFVILPSVLIFGILLILFGAFRENRRLLGVEVAPEEKLPIVNLNNPKHQAAIIVVSLGLVILVTATIYGSFKAYEYTDSDEFCGTVCHVVMEPEHTAYKNSAHSHVGCIKCHIGPGAQWFVKSKISGSYQLYSVMFNKYSRPIETPVHDLRPSPQTCEQCHSPQHFYSEKNISFDFFTSDSANSEYIISMLLKTGGGSVELGNNEGIHWSMYLSNEIDYYPLDYKRQIIPWVRVTNKQSRKETYYIDKSYNIEITDSILKSSAIRRLDCIDCHNRPSHVYNIPNKVVNAFMKFGKIDKTIPYIKNVAVQTLESGHISQENSLKDIKSTVMNYYKNNYPEIAKTKYNSLMTSIKSINKIFVNNYFPNMKVSWRRYPNNIGHLYSKGCFRCHDGKHVSPEGKVLGSECNNCHTIILQQPPGQPVQNGTDLDFVHPGGMDKFIKSRMCPGCHAAKVVDPKHLKE